MRHAIPERESLTVWQQRLLELLARGYNTAGIKAVTFYSEAYIYYGLRGLHRILGVGTHAGAVVEGLRRGLIDMPAQEEMQERDDQDGG